MKNFASFEKPTKFDVRSLLPGCTNQEVAGKLAVYFNQVSGEFEPLLPSQIPCTKPGNIPCLCKFEVAKRIKSFRKPKSMVPGDVFPSLVTKFADFLALPLTNIFNEISSTYVWPVC